MKKIKKLLSLLLAFSMIMTMSTFASVATFADGLAENSEGAELTSLEESIALNSLADSGECGDNVWWSLDDDGMLTISGSGKMSDYKTNSPWFSQRHEIKSIVIENGVTGIGDYAFYGIDMLTCTNIEIPASVTSIGRSAFEFCVGPTSITFGTGSKLTSIGEYAFCGCRNLESIEIPYGVTKINGWTFDCCTSLTSVKIPESVKTIKLAAFFKCYSLASIKIPESVTSIDANSLFAECNNLTNIVVDSNNKTYDSRDNCNAIIETKTNTLVVGCMNTKIPASVTSIGDRAFYCYTNLTSIELPDGITSIGDDAFCYTNLTSIELPDGLTNIGDSAFCDCGLTSIEIPMSVETIGGIALGYTSLNNKRVPIENFVITGYVGSVAESYAKENSFTFVKKGVVEPKYIEIIQSSYGYTGKAITPKVWVVNNSERVIADSNFSVKYSNNINAGTAKITVTFKGDYKNCKALTKTFKITKAANPMKLKESSATVDHKTLRAKKLTYKIAFKPKAQGKVTYKLSGKAREAGITVSPKGKITIPKGCSQGAYTITVKAAGNNNYKAGSASFEVVVK